MIRRETVLVLGAGASKPFRYPTGAELRTILCQEVGQPGRHLTQVLLSGGWSVTDQQVFNMQFERSGFYSIDRFLAMRPEFMEVGQIAVAAAISACEDEANLYRTDQGSRGWKSGTSDWYAYLWSTLTTGARTAEEVVSQNKLAVITFNYDRSLERFLYNAFCASYGLDLAVAADLVRRITIHHVYGCLAAAGKEFDVLTTDVDFNELKARAAQIKIMPHERPEEDEQCVSLLKAAQQVFFLGFGFDEMNCARLGIRKAHEPGAVKSIYGTCLSMTDNEREIASDLIRGAREPKLHDIDCLQLLRNYAGAFR